MNPFNPNFGKVPQLFLDRNQIVNEYISELDSNLDSPLQTSVIYGVRGSGKTSLLTDISNQLCEKGHWIVIDLTTNQNLIPTLTYSLYQEATSKFQQLIGKLKGFKVSGFEFQLQNDVPQSIQYQMMLKQILKQLAEKHIKVLVTLDEVKATKEVREFASLYQLLIRENLPIALIMTGLPENISELQNNSVLTFLLRSNRIELSPLSHEAIIKAFAEKFNDGNRKATPSILHRLTLLTRGYAYAFQLLGYLVWKNGTEGDVIDDQLIDRLLPEYQLALSRNAYTKIYQDLSYQDREFVRAMANSADDKVKMKYIGEQMEKPSNYIANYRQRLLDSQLIRVAGYGYVSFTLPLFKDFVQWYSQYDDSGF